MANKVCKLELLAPFWASNVLTASKTLALSVVLASEFFEVEDSMVLALLAEEVALVVAVVVAVVAIFCPGLAMVSKVLFSKLVVWARMLLLWLAETVILLTEVVFPVSIDKGVVGLVGWLLVSGCFLTEFEVEGLFLMDLKAGFLKALA